MIVDCPRCESPMDCHELGQADPDPDQNAGVFKLVLVQCPSCIEPLLAISEAQQDRYGTFIWGPGTRLWPDPEVEVDSAVADLARHPLEQAMKCFKAGAYDACAVMCRRTVEGACRHFDGRRQSLKLSLESMREKQMIDQRLYDWGESLRINGNLGAHASDVNVSKDHARYLLDFASAFCQYVFVLNTKWKEYQAYLKKSNKSLHPTASGGG